MRNIISALIFCFLTTGALAQDKKPIELAPNAPDHHVVVRGDTLWGIAKLFLKNPYRWPEIWHLNADEIKNPHLIYPGQVVYLDTSGGRPRLRLGHLVGGEVKLEPKIYSEKEKAGIPAIPQQDIAPFLSQPLVVDDEEFANAPRVVATEEGHVNVGTGSKIYVKGLNDDNVKQWNLYRLGKVLKDPDTNEVLGHEAIFVGTAKVLAEGKPASEDDGLPVAATLEVTSNKLEISKGDRLKAAITPDVVNYVPHAPSSKIVSKIISIYGGVGEAGTFSIVTISKGSQDGIELGHVLALYRTGRAVVDHLDPANGEVRLPDERYGLIFVFRVFKRVSYALVMEAQRPVIIGDRAETP
jgi:LysM domain